MCLTGTFTKKRKKLKFQYKYKKAKLSMFEFTIVFICTLWSISFSADSWVAFYRSRSAICQEKTVCNGDMCTEVCKIGSVEVDQWSDYVLSFQRWLQFNQSFIYHQIPGTHNSHISVAYGFGIERDFVSALNYGSELTWHGGDLNLGEGVDQYLSITDQFNMGIRHIEVDINWGPWVVNESSSAADGIVVCHTPVVDPIIEVELNDYLDNRGLNGKVNYSIHHFDCKEQFVSFYNSMNEIKQWLLNSSNLNEFVIVYFDTKWDILKYQAEWGINFLQETFGDMIFTPNELKTMYNNEWPSLNELIINQGKRLLFENVKEGWAEAKDSFIFTPPLWHGFQYGADSFNVYPNCTILNKSTYGKNFTRALDDTIEDIFEIDRQYRNIIQIATRCGGNIVSPHMINPIEMWRFVWTFARGEPKGLWNNNTNINNNNNNNKHSKDSGNSNTCIAMKRSGFWAVKDCNNSYPIACVNETDTTDWYVSIFDQESNGKGKRKRKTKNDYSRVNWHFAKQFGSDKSCPTGYVFSTPTDGYQNSHLQAQALSNYVWLSVDIEQFHQVYTNRKKLH